MSSQIQSIIFHRNYWNTYQASKWLSEHQYVPIKPVHVTSNYLRYRLQLPKMGAKYRTIDFGDHIKAIIRVIRKSRRKI